MKVVRKWKEPKALMDELVTNYCGAQCWWPIYTCGRPANSSGGSTSGRDYAGGSYTQVRMKEWGLTFPVYYRNAVSRGKAGVVNYSFLRTKLQGGL